ncbi:MAG: hypothetical protein ACTSU5_21965 [Promethearchaeota archaeon]
MQFEVMELGMQVNGRTIFTIADAVRIVKVMVRDIFLEVGLPAPDEIDPRGWYSQQKWLDAFRVIAEKIGPRTLFTIGTKIPENAKFPPGIDSVEKALAAIDVAYHMNHRNADGQILYDADTGTMLEGIGHYRYEAGGDNVAIMECNNPYPCEFDQGIIVAMARRFVDNPTIRHEDDATCRRKGAASERYVVEW